MTSDFVCTCLQYGLSFGVIISSFLSLASVWIHEPKCKEDFILVISLVTMSVFSLSGVPLCCRRHRRVPGVVNRKYCYNYHSLFHKQFQNIYEAVSLYLMYSVSICTYVGLIINRTSTMLLPSAMVGYQGSCLFSGAHGPFR